MSSYPSRISFSDAFWFQEGPGVRNTQFRHEGVKLLNVANITKEGQIDLDKTDRHLEEQEAFGKYKHFLADQGDLVIASSGISIDEDGLLRTRGAFIEARHLPLCMNTSTIRFKPKSGVSDLSYLRHWLQSPDFRVQITRLVTGSAQKNFGPTHLKTLTIPLPPLEEQKRIAAILDQADELRRKRQRALDRLNQLGQAIFIEMFGGLEGSDMEPLGSLTSKIGSGATPKGGDSSYKAEGVPLIRSMNVRDGHFLDKGLAFIDDKQASKLDNVVVRGGDVLLNITGASVARVCTAPESMDGARVNQHVSIIRPTERLLSVFVEAYLLLPMIKKKLLNIAESGATRQAITKAQIEQLPIPVPPISRQNEFAKRVGTVHRQQDSSSSYIDRLEGLFASLQSRAFRGELTASSPKEAAA
jgi:type I restriction enzyme, S subunit